MSCKVSQFEESAFRANWLWRQEEQMRCKLGCCSVDVKELQSGGLELGIHCTLIVGFKVPVSQMRIHSDKVKRDLIVITSVLKKRRRYKHIITLRSGQNDRHFPDDIFKWIFRNEIAIKIC